MELNCFSRRGKFRNDNSLQNNLMLAVPYLSYGCAKNIPYISKRIVYEIHNAEEKFVR